MYSICIGKMYITKYKNWFSEVMYAEKENMQRDYQQVRNYRYVWYRD